MDFDFSFFLVVAAFLTGVVWGVYALYMRTKGYAGGGDFREEPILVEYARSFFPIVLIVLVLRSFLVEPFRIPSGSMIPTLQIGDFILVNKFAYGVRLPVLHNKILDVGEPQRGDVFVFRFPNNPSLDYIKRVIGLPGDKIKYVGKQLYINGTKIKQTPLGVYHGVGQGAAHAIQSIENLSNVEHEILTMPQRPALNDEFVIPQGHYFAMGDNRDNSNDSRYWGMVPEANLVGKAFFVWMNWDSKNGGVGLDRLGTVIK